MLASELTVEQVKTELQSLIDAEPTNTGWADVEGGYPDAGCVYFLDEEGAPVSPTQRDASDESDQQLVTPVCIIGRWVHDFHREYIPEMKQIFIENRSLGSCISDEVPFTEDVLRLLTNAQGTQDLEGTTWANINLDACMDEPIRRSVVNIF